MDTLPLVALAGAAVGGALAGAAACYWPLKRVIVELRDRLKRSEQARNGAVERSAQARDQIAQLNRAITELRRAHSTHNKPESAREQLEKSLAESEAKTLALPRHEPVRAFADTQVMSKL
jgi:chromosome segregation ATPase